MLDEISCLNKIIIKNTTTGSFIKKELWKSFEMKLLKAKNLMNNHCCQTRIFF